MHMLQMLFTSFSFHNIIVLWQRKSIERVIKDHIKDEMWNQTKNKGKTYLIALAGSRTEKYISF